MSDKTRFEISTDELAHRMKLQEESQDPGRKAVLILEAAIDKVLKRLGVDVTQDNIPEQMEALGIIMTENSSETTPQLNGFYFFLRRGTDIISYAWAGAARIDSTGRCFCDIQYFLDDKLDEIGGIKILQ